MSCNNFIKPHLYNSVAIGPLKISESTNGESTTLTCSAEFVPYPLAVDVNFEWTFGLTNSTTLPPGVIKSNSSIYSSTLQFSSLLSTHTEIYTCYFSYTIGGNQKCLTASITVSTSTFEIPTTLIQSPTTSISDTVIFPTISVLDIKTQLPATSASDATGNHSDPRSSVAVVIITVVFILIIIAAIVAAIVITAILYR